MLEFWRAGGSTTSTSAEAARAVEAEGWDGQMFMDSQSLGGDPYVLMGVWASATERLMLSTGVTNPVTRHPAVTASAAATLQAISNGRTVLGIGRGDSALAYLGYAPVTLPVFERSLRDLQSLLSRNAIALGGDSAKLDAPSSATLSLAHRPTETRLKWLSPDVPKVPIDVAATGPKVIAMAAEIAERVTFSVGAIEERLQWGIQTARDARKARGCQGAEPSYGAQIIVICHPDVDAMRATATSYVAPLARFQVIQGSAVGPQSGSDTENLSTVRKRYDMNEHGKVESQNKLSGESFSWDFVSRFAIVGPPDYCTQRLLELVAIGIERFVVVGPGFHSEAYPGQGSLFAKEVIPAVRAAMRLER